MVPRVFDQKKFREVVLYVAERSVNDPRFGAVKLNKVLYYADFNAFRRLGHSITGATYQKLGEGPAPREMLPTKRFMLDAGDIEVELRHYFNTVQRRITPKRSADMSAFTPEEIAIIEETVGALWHMNGREVSDLSHQELGWISARHGEAIPYETAWLSAEPVPQDAEEYAEEVAARIGR